MTAAVIPVTCVVGPDHTSPTGCCLGVCWVSAAGRDEAPGASGWGSAVASPMSPCSTQPADARPGGPRCMSVSLGGCCWGPVHPSPSIVSCLRTRVLPFVSISTCVVICFTMWQQFFKTRDSKLFGNSNNSLIGFIAMFTCLALTY